MIMENQNKTMQVELINYLPNIGIDNVKQEILDGLNSIPKYISPKFFYDGKGSELFEQITKLDEYYPTRTEKSIIRDKVKDLSIDFENLNIVELGSGDSSKISLLLEQIPEQHIHTINYFPVDISKSAIEKSTNDLQAKFPLKSITGVVVDFFHQMHLIPKTGRRLFCFFGSTIGNFDKKQSKDFISALGRSMQQGDMLLIGMDLVKNIDVLEAAYNDKKGITAMFNTNILNVVNNLSGSDFNENDFEHYSFFNTKESRIEMHLRAIKDVELSYDTETIKIHKGELIHSENSHKFTPKDIDAIANWAGIDKIKSLTDSNEWFSLNFFVKP